MTQTLASSPSATDESLDQSAPIFKLPVKRYQELVDAGVFNDDPVELLKGILVRKISKNPIHSAVTGFLNRMISAMLPTNYFTRLGEPVTTADSEPEPDISIVRGKLTNFCKRHPTPGEAALVIEVANASLSRDRNLKRRVYAAAGCANYWIVNTVDRTIEVYTKPTAGVYADRTIFRENARVGVVLEGTTIGEINLVSLFPTA